MAVAEAKMALARDAGFRVIALSAVWTRPLTAPPPPELDALRTAAETADAAGIRPIVAVYQLSSNTPLTGDDRGEFASYAAAIAREVPELRTFVVGNEPNLNLFWTPQYDLDSSDAAAPAYLALLAETYDALKEVDDGIDVIGGALGPRGGDDPLAPRQTQSPTAFLQDLGLAYRESGRQRPVMDMLALHPYGDNSLEPPDLAHPLTTTIGLADYDKLVQLLGEAFDGTAQRGTSLPIVYAEYGIETVVPEQRAAAYAEVEPPTTHPVSPELQGERYVAAVRMAACQPTVRMLLLFHVSDEPDLRGWQSGVYYADDVPKPSLPIVRKAIEGATCPG